MSRETDYLRSLERAANRSIEVPLSPATSAAMRYLMLPALRLFIPFSSVDAAGNPVDLSGQARHLTNAGTSTFGVTGITPYGITVVASGQYFHRTDESGLDVTGALTLGGWFRTGALAGTQYCATKWHTTGNQRAYALYFTVTGQPYFSITTDGTTGVSATGSAGEFSAATWHFFAGRYTPGTELAYYLDGTLTANAVGIPASIFNSSASLLLGGVSATAAFGGYMAQFFLCAGALSVTVLDSLYDNTRGLFGV